MKHTKVFFKTPWGFVLTVGHQETLPILMRHALAEFSVSNASKESSFQSLFRNFFQNIKIVETTHLGNIHPVVCFQEEEEQKLNCAVLPHFIRQLDILPPPCIVPNLVLQAFCACPWGSCEFTRLSASKLVDQTLSRLIISIARIWCQEMVLRVRPC